MTDDRFDHALIVPWWLRGGGTPPLIHLLYCSAILAAWMLSAVFNAAPQRDVLWPAPSCAPRADGQGCSTALTPGRPAPPVETAGVLRCQQIPQVAGCAAGAWPQGTAGVPGGGR